MATSFEDIFFQYLDEAKRSSRYTTLNLGGASGPSGGTGGGVGFVGRLPQSRIAYDSTEAETNDTPASGTSLVDNLNHIRARLANLEASGVGGAGASITVKENGATIATGINTLNFIGATVAQVGTQANITISGTGGSTLTQEQVEDYVGGMVTGNTETGIAVTYDDGAGKLNFDATHNHTGVYLPLTSGVLNGNQHDHIGGDGNPITEGAFSFSDVTTANVSTTAHGLMPRLDNNATHFLNGVGNWVTTSGTGGGSSAFHGCRVYRITSPQTIANNANDAVVWNAEDFDTDSYHATDDDDLIIPAGLGGYYHIVFHLDFSDSDYFDSGESIMATISIFNGDTPVKTPSRQSSITKMFGGDVETSCITYVNEGYGIRGLAYQSTGGDLDIGYTQGYTSLAIHYLGA